MNGRRAALLAAAIPALAAVPEAGAGARPGLSGSIRSVAALSTPSASRPADATVLNRLRLEAAPEIGPLSFEIAWELAVTFSRRGSDAPSDLRDTAGGGRAGTESGDWLDLQWAGTDSAHVSTEHRFDRLHVDSSANENLELTIGRQAVSWGTTLFLTPADPFVPFHPADRFREYRRGIDALRLRYYPGPLSEIDLVVRPSRLEGREELTALARGLATFRNWEISAWAGSLYGDASAAAGAAGAIGEWAVRFEAVARGGGDRPVGRAAVGIDRAFTLAWGDLGLLVEYQRDGLGVTERGDLARIFDSREYRRGELQVFGRDEAALRVSFQPDPRWDLSAIALFNLNESSALVAPGFSWSPSDEATVEGGVYFDVGGRAAADSDPDGAADDEPGLAGFLSLTWHF